MISHGKDIKVFSGNANPKLAEEICKLMGTKLGEAEVGTFSDGEIFVSLYETVRGPHHRGHPLLRLCPAGPQGQGP